jgi:hypothetical protein
VVFIWKQPNAAIPGSWQLRRVRYNCRTLAGNGKQTRAVT